MIRRLGEFIIEGGWPIFWELVGWPVKGGLLYVAFLGGAYAIGKAVQ